MAPRRYDMTKRARALEETRHQILSAVVKLHQEKGIVATTYEDIAKAAGVAQATVYRHFPTLRELVPACGTVVAKQTRAPGAEILEGKAGAEERMTALVESMFQYYGRARASSERALFDSPHVPELAYFIQQSHAQLRALIELALGDGAPECDVRLALALTDFGTWRSLALAGLEKEASRIITETILARI